MSTRATMKRRRLVAPALVGLFAVCEGLGAGPCYHDFRDPVLSIRTVTDSVSNQSIPRIALTHLLVNGHATVIITPSSTRIMIQGDTVWCEVACGLGNEEGMWSFDVSAAGYRTRSIQVSARYARFDGGCPSSNTGSTTMSLRLLPASTN